VLRLAWYIRPIRFENSIRNRIKRPIRFEIRFERKKTIRRSLIINDECKNRFLKHARDNRQNTFIESQSQHRPNQNKPYSYDVTDDDDLQKLLGNSYSLKRPPNFYFLTFCGTIYQHLLRTCVCIAVSSYKLLFINFVKNRCISPLTHICHYLPEIYDVT